MNSMKKNLYQSIEFSATGLTLEEYICLQAELLRTTQEYFFDPVFEKEKQEQDRINLEIQAIETRHKLFVERITSTQKALYELDKDVAKMEYERLLAKIKR